MPRGSCNGCRYKRFLISTSLFKSWFWLHSSQFCCRFLMRNRHKVFRIRLDSKRISNTLSTVLSYGRDALFATLVLYIFAESFSTKIVTSQRDHHHLHLQVSHLFYYTCLISIRVSFDKGGIHILIVVSLAHVLLSRSVDAA